MRALRYHGRHDVRVETAPDPRIAHPEDAIVRVTTAAICGSDLHLYGGLIPTLRRGDVLGHEFMGEVVEVGREVRALRLGDRVVVPFNIACGRCFYCQRELWSLCDATNPNAGLAERRFGASPAGLFGYSHMFGGYPGGQAEYVRVPFADVNHVKVPGDVGDEEALFVGDVLATGYMAAENCGDLRGATVAVWGCGPVGLFALMCARLLGATKLLAIERVPERIELARARLGAQTVDVDRRDVIAAVREATGGRGPDACIDAVGMEAHGHGLLGAYDRAMQAVGIESDRSTALRQAIEVCRKGGTVSVPGVYGGAIDRFPFGAAFNKALTIRGGQTHTHRYARRLLERIAAKEIDSTLIITHRLALVERSIGFQT